MRCPPQPSSCWRLLTETITLASCFPERFLVTGTRFQDYVRNMERTRRLTWTDPMHSAACNRVSTELDSHLASIGLGNDQLVLAGFSQGAAISAYTGLHRRCLGVLPFGGPCPPRPALLPDHNDTRVCVVVGDRDHCVAYDELQREFAKYRRADPATDGVHVIPGQGHTVSETSEAIGLAFLRSCGCE